MLRRLRSDWVDLQDHSVLWISCHPGPQTSHYCLFYMDGPALALFQWMSWNAQLTSWSTFLHALKTRFASSTYEDPTGLLFKLTQRASVNEYLSEFESLTNRIIGLPTPFLLSCFVSRLSPEIRREVQARQTKKSTKHSWTSTGTKLRLVYPCKKRQ